MSGDRPSDREPPILLLDVDGVLNSRRFYEATFARTGRAARADAVCPDLVARMNAVLAATGAMVVVSSTWHLHADCRAMLRRRGLRARFARDWRTPRLSSGAGHDPHRLRGCEIADRLARHPTRRWAIVDDDSDMLEAQRPRFVQTTNEHGLTAAVAEGLIAALTPGGGA